MKLRSVSFFLNHTVFSTNLLLFKVRSQSADCQSTLNDGDELSDDEQLDDNEHETISNQHIHENFKVDILFIKGSQDYDLVKYDFMMFEKFVNPGGFIVFDEIGSGFC